MIKLCAFSDEYSSNLDEQIKCLKLNNIKYMEIRGINGKNILDISIDEAININEKLKENDIYVWSIGSPIGKVDINTDINLYYEKVHHICKLANIFNCKNIRMFSFFNAYDKKDLVFKYLNEFVKIANKYNVVLNHENEKDIYGDNIERVLEIYENVLGIKLVYDPANFIQCGVNSNESLSTLFKLTNYFHIKDAKLDGSVVPAGFGCADINRLISMVNNDVCNVSLIGFFQYSGIFSYPIIIPSTEPTVAPLQSVSKPVSTAIQMDFPKSPFPYSSEATTIIAFDMV